MFVPFQRWSGAGQGTSSNSVGGAVNPSPDMKGQELEQATSFYQHSPESEFRTLKHLVVIAAFLLNKHSIKLKIGIWFIVKRISK